MSITAREAALCGSVKEGLRESLRRLLDEEFDALLFAHGEPMAEGGHAALREFVG